MTSLLCCVVVLWAMALKADEVTHDRFIPQYDVTLRVLDKITGHVKVIQGRVSKPMTVGTLEVMVPYCGKSAPDDAIDFAAFMVIDEKKASHQSHRLFSGWMFASTPSISALDHPLMDVWLDHCGVTQTIETHDDKATHDTLSVDAADD